MLLRQCWRQNKYWHLNDKIPLERLNLSFVSFKAEQPLPMTSRAGIDENTGISSGKFWVNVCRDRIRTVQMWTETRGGKRRLENYEVKRVQQRQKELTTLRYQEDRKHSRETLVHDNKM